MANKKALSDLDSDMILASILDPKGSPLPAKYDQQAKRVMQAAKLWDDYPNDRKVATMLQAKYPISYKTATRDVALAKQLYKTEHTFDFDAAMAWMIKDQIELINQCKKKGDLNAWNKAKKVLREIIGDRPVQVEDPRRMEKNVINIQINNNGHAMNIPIEKVRELAPQEVGELVNSLSEPITDDEAVDIMNS